MIQRIFEWLLTDHRFMECVGLLVLVIGIMKRGFFDQPIDGLLVMILGLQGIILAKVLQKK